MKAKKKPKAKKPKVVDSDDPRRSPTARAFLKAYRKSLKTFNDSDYDY